MSLWSWRPEWAAEDWLGRESSAGVSEAEDWLGREGSRLWEGPAGALYRRQAAAKNRQPSAWGREVAAVAAGPTPRPAAALRGPGTRSREPPARPCEGHGGHACGLWGHVPASDRERHFGQRVEGWGATRGTGAVSASWQSDRMGRHLGARPSAPSAGVSRATLRPAPRGLCRGRGVITGVWSPCSGWGPHNTTEKGGAGPPGRLLCAEPPSRAAQIPLTLGYFCLIHREINRGQPGCLSPNPFPKGPLPVGHGPALGPGKGARPSLGLASGFISLGRLLPSPVGEIRNINSVLCPGASAESQSRRFSTQLETEGGAGKQTAPGPP